MHEDGVCEAILRIVEKRSNGRQVMRVSVAAGIGQGLEPDAMREEFRLTASGGPAEGAVLDLEILPGNGSCEACAASFEVVDAVAACPACGSPSITVEDIDELYIKSIEYEMSFGDVIAGTRTDQGGAGHQ